MAQNPCQEYPPNTQSIYQLPDLEIPLLTSHSPSLYSFAVLCASWSILFFLAWIVLTSIAESQKTGLFDSLLGHILSLQTRLLKMSVLQCRLTCCETYTHHADNLT